MPAHSLNTYIFIIDQGGTAIRKVREKTVAGSPAYYDLQGRRLDKPRGLCIERHPDGTSKKVYVE